MGYEVYLSVRFRGRFLSTNIVFASSEEALSYAEIRSELSSMIGDYKIVETDANVTHVLQERRLTMLPYQKEETNVQSS